MTSLEKFLSTESIKLLGEDEYIYLDNILRQYSGLPTLRNLWSLIDNAWDMIGCNKDTSENLLNKFYKHPVWILNGIYSEHDALSKHYRDLFTSYIVAVKPKRILDIGGGFGALARNIGKNCPGSIIEIYEPHPSPLAIALAESTPNVRYTDQAQGIYDLVIATDVFEHLHFPLSCLSSSLSHLNRGGHYLIANCFSPVIKCHLLQNNHLNVSWTRLAETYGLTHPLPVAYGYAYTYTGKSNKYEVDTIWKISKFSYSISRFLPKGRFYLNKLIFSILVFFIIKNKNKSSL